MPTLLDSSNPQNIKQEPLGFKVSRGPLLQPIQPQFIPNYDANKASEYITNPVFNTLDNTGRSYLEMENEMSLGQSSLEQWGHGLTKGAANIPLKFMEGMGYAYGVGKWLGKDIINGNGTIDDMINNDFAQWFHAQSKNLDKSLPIFGSFDYQKGNIVEKMSTAKFWAGDFVDGLAFLASAYGGSIIGKGIGKGAALAAEGMGAAEATTAGINKWASFAGGTIYNTVSESGFEAKDGYDNMYPELLKKYKETLYNKYTDPTTGSLLINEADLEQEADQMAKNKAGEHAANIFTSNLALLSLSNSLQMKAFMGNPIDETKSLWRKIVNGEVKQGEISGWKEAVKGFGIGVVSDSLWEEGMQNAVQQYQKKKSLGKVDENGFTGGYFKEWLKGFSNTEGQASMILGALIGGPFQAMSSFSESKQRENQIGFLSKEVDKQKDALNASDKIFQSFVENRYKKDSEGKIQYDENDNPILNIDWYKEKAYQIQLDEDYQKEKITALLNGDVTAAHVVDQYYTSRKLWNYLANPLYETTDHAFAAFEKNLKLQGQEYFEQSKVIQEKRLQEQEANDQPFSNPIEPLGQEIDKESLDKKQFSKDMDAALINATEMKNHFDEIQKNIKVDFFDPKSGLLNEKLSKALFHEATKRTALKKALSNPALSDNAKEDISELILSSEEFTKELYSKEGRSKYLDSEKTTQDLLENKIKEFNEILEKYKEQPEAEVKKTKVNSLKQKAKGLIKPILSKFDINKAQQEQTVEEKKESKPLTLEEKLSKEDKEKLKLLNHDIDKTFYEYGNSYLNRVNDAYATDVAVGKRYQYYKELGEEEIRKSKLQDDIESILSEIDNININSFQFLDEQTYNKVQQLLYQLSNLIQNYVKEFNEDKGYSKTNYTSKDLKYIQQLEQRVAELLNQFEESIDNNIQNIKNELSNINTYIAEVNDFLVNTIDELNNFFIGIDSELMIDSDNLANEAYALFGKDLIYYSFMNNYFLSKEEYENIKKSAALMKLSQEEILGVMFNIIDNNGIADNNDSESQQYKHNLIQYLLTTLPEPEFDTEEGLYQTLDLKILEKIKQEFIETKTNYNKSFNEVVEDSKKYVNSNKFLQMYKLPEGKQEEFYEALFIEENPEYAFNTTKILVDIFKKNFKEKNQSELDKIEDVFFYQNRLETLKDVYKLLDKNIETKVLKDLKKELEELINTLENYIIPLAIKNQGNRKVAQEISLGIRDKSYFNQLGLDVEIAVTTGQVQLKNSSNKLATLIKKIYGLDITTIKLADKFNFLLIEKIINELKTKPQEELSSLFDLIKQLKQEVAKEIQNFQNTRGEARFYSSTNFDDYLNNPDTIVERLIYEMSDFNNEAARTYTEKENWFSSPLYNYSKHLSPALLLDELKKKKFSGSTIMPYQKLVNYLELHLEYNALFNLEKNLKSDLSYVNYFKNLRETFQKQEFTPTYQQEIALREAYAWWNNPKMILSYLKGVAGTGKTSVFLKYFIETNNITLDSILLSAHDTPQVNALKGLSPEVSGILLQDLLTKDKTFFDKTSLLVIDEINANSEEVIKSILDKITVINKDRADNNKLKVLFLGDPTQLRASNKPFIEYFSSYANTYSVKYGETLKVFSPLTVAYRSDVGAINNLSTAFRDTNSTIKNIDLQSSSTLQDVNTKGAFLSSQERTNGTLNDIFKRLEVVKANTNTKAIIVSNEAEVALYKAELTKRNISNVEVLQITEAQGRTFDEAYVDINKNNLANTKLGQVNKSDPEYFYNTAMYTAVSRAKNFVLINDNGAEFTHSIDTEVTSNNIDLLKEKSELKQNMQNYLDFADSVINDVPISKPEPTKPEEPPIIVSDPPLDPEDDPEGDEPGSQPDPTDDPPIISDPAPEIPQDTELHTIQNAEYNTLTEPVVMGVKQPSLAQQGNEVVYMKSADGNIYVYFKSNTNPEYYTYLSTIYYKNLRDDVSSEKQLKENYNSNKSSKLISYDKQSIEASSLNREHQIGSGQIHHTQRLQFLYEKFVNKQSIEKEIAEKGGLYNYLQEKLLPLILKKDSETETYGDITNYYVFIPRPETEKGGRDPNLIQGITNIEYGQPYIKFDIEKTNDKGQKRVQTFYVKLESPMLHKNDSLAAPLISFYNSIVNIEKELEALSLPEIKLGTSAFNNLLLEFKNDFTSKEDGKEKDFKGKEITKYSIVPKNTSVVTKEDVQEILKDYNIKDEDLDKILAIFQKESKTLIPLLYSSKKDKVKVSANGYLEFLGEQIQEGNIDEEFTQDYLNLINSINLDDQGKQLNDIILNKTYLNSTNVIRSFRASDIDINSLNETIKQTVREIRKQLTAASFVPIIAGENKGKFYAFDPLIGQVIVIDRIPEPRFVSQSFAKKEGIEMFDYEEVRLTKRNSPVQTSFNIIARTNKTLNRNTPEEIKIQRSYTLTEGESSRAILFAPTLVKESKYDYAFDKKYYSILKKAFNDHIDKLKKEDLPFEFKNLMYKDDYGNTISFQYHEAISKKTGESIWEKQGIIGKFRKEASLQNEDALEVMKQFLIEQGATISTDSGEEVASQQLFDNMENSFNEPIINSKHLEGLVGEQAFDESGSSLYYRKNVDRDYISTSQNEEFGGNRFENNSSLQNSVTTRLKGVVPSKVVVAMNGVKKTEAVVTPAPVIEPVVQEQIERKILQEEGNYSLEQLENGKFGVFNNSEFPQEYIYDSVEDAGKKYNSFFENEIPASQNVETFNLNNSISEDYKKVVFNFIIRTQEIIDQSEVDVIEKSVNKIFQKANTFDDIISKIGKKYNTDANDLQKELEGYYLKNKC